MTAIVTRLKFPLSSSHGEAVTSLSRDGIRTILAMHMILKVLKVYNGIRKCRMAR